MDKLHHIAIQVSNIQKAVDWYTDKFNVGISYQDESWAMLDFDNIQLALVISEQHPPHIAVENIQAESFGQLTTHRDGTKSVYLSDPSGNSVEILKSKS